MIELNTEKEVESSKFDEFMEDIVNDVVNWIDDMTETFKFSLRLAVSMLVISAISVFGFSFTSWIVDKLSGL